MPAKPIDRLRDLCLTLPEAQEVEGWGEPTFRVRNRIFAMYAGADSHHGGGRESVWCKAKPVTQDMMIRTEPDRYFSPPYVGPKGWVGAWLGRSTDWVTLAGLVRDAYVQTAPKRVAMRLHEPVEAEAVARPNRSRKKSVSKAVSKSLRKPARKSK